MQYEPESLMSPGTGLDGDGTLIKHSVHTPYNYSLVLVSQQHHFLLGTWSPKCVLSSTNILCIHHPALDVT